MAKCGVRRQYSDAGVAAIVDKFSRYVDRTEIPILAEFCYLNHVSRTAIYDYPEFDEVRNRCLMKKEAQLERLAGNGLWDSSMARFSLKQMGWKDKQEVVHDGKIDSNVQIYLPTNNRLTSAAAQPMLKEPEDEDDD